MMNWMRGLNVMMSVIRVRMKISVKMSRMSRMSVMIVMSVMGKAYFSN